MPQTHADSERLRAFAIQLRHFAHRIEEQTLSLASRLERLHDTWQDEGFQVFREHFDRTRVVLHVLSEESERVAPVLERDAEAIDEFARIQPGS